ncbi:protein hunchback [Euwallacea similis]|uniref:protein hunchback n=1 Tax=Euwallacea similis TaxID=1736056 RepID=UPI00344E08F9
MYSDSIVPTKVLRGGDSSVISALKTIEEMQSDVSKQEPASSEQHAQENTYNPMQPAGWPKFGNAVYPANGVKEEPMDDAPHDSGVTSCSDLSISPASIRSNTNTTSPAPANTYQFSSANSNLPQPVWYNHPQSPEGAKQPNNPSPVLANKNEGNVNGMDGFRSPKMNSHGKMKVHKCKQCDFSAYTKVEFWAHSEVHIKTDKALKCPQCPFVTEYKHHLEYHLLNHAGAKPFKCPQCEYSCVNKSMLNSHLKSHSKVYQYRCFDCNYETKYCHSLKMHLRKYTHTPDVVLNPDGTPNPYPVIDVYGTRRGPKVKKTGNSPPIVGPPAIQAPEISNQPKMPEVSPPMMPEVPMMPEIPMMPEMPMMPEVPMMPPMLNPLLNPQAILPFPLLPLPGFPPMGPEMMLNIHNMFRERLEELAKHNMATSNPEPIRDDTGALDLTNKTSERGDSENEDEAMTTVFSNVEVVENQPEVKTEGEAEEDITVSKQQEFECEPCGISFEDEVLYRIHMGYHGYNSPFTCNMCGEECKNKVNFFMHIAKVAH